MVFGNSSHGLLGQPFAMANREIAKYPFVFKNRKIHSGTLRG